MSSHPLINSEKIVMTLQCPIGPEANILKPSCDQVHRLWLNNPILSVADTEMLKRNIHRGWKTKVVDITFDYRDGTTGYVDAFQRISSEAQEAAETGHQLIILSDRAGGPERCPVSSLVSQPSLTTYYVLNATIDATFSLCSFLTIIDCRKLGTLSK